jgi:hypothetical protein
MVEIFLAEISSLKIFWKIYSFFLRQLGATSSCQLDVSSSSKKNTCLLVLATSGLYCKQVMIVIYDRNDIGLYYKTRDDRN